MEHSLEVYTGTDLIFYSDRKWLYPLFELEEFLGKSHHEPQSLILMDKIIGRAAALLLMKMGIKNIKAETMSELGKDVLEAFYITFEYKNLVHRISCQTEEILKDETNLETAYKILKKRAKIKKFE